MQFAPWLPFKEQLIEAGKPDERLFAGSEEHVEKAIAIPDEVSTALTSGSCDSEQVICQLKESFQLDQSSLEKPDC
ncbi:hypothetical protein ABFA07_016851 [Porites harrisoni]